MNEEIKHRKIFAQHCKDCGQDYFMHPDEAILFFEQMEDLQSRLEQAEKDSKMVDWLESSETSHGFCHSGYGDYRYYAHQQGGYKTVREVIDAAMQSAKESQ